MEWYIAVAKKRGWPKVVELLAQYPEKEERIKMLIKKKVRKMSGWLVATVGVIYFCTAIDSFFKDNMGLAVAFLGYSIGSIGLWMQTK